MRTMPTPPRPGPRAGDVVVLRESGECVEGEVIAVLAEGWYKVGFAPAEATAESKGGSGMPVYEYYCDSCRRTVAVTLSISQHGRMVPACPQCGGKGLQAVVSTFFSQTSRKS